MKRNYKTLLLNKDYSPMDICNWKKAITLILKNKVISLDFYPNDLIKDGKNNHYSIPSVIILNRYIYHNYQKITLTKENLLARDMYQCQYCLKNLKPCQLTIDHVFPRSKWNKLGTPTCWTNVVAACFSCNRKKGNLTCAAAGMFPAKLPVQPGLNEIFFGMHCHGKVEPLWIKWLEVFDSFKKLNTSHTEGLYVSN